jgi:mannose-6-phosphate isomerase-like protein (cupin superfamily)
MLNLRTAVAVLVLTAFVGSAGAQSTPPAGQPPVPPTAKPAAPPPTARPTTGTAGTAQSAAHGGLTVSVTDASGTALPDVKVTMTGPLMRQGATGKDGTARFQAIKPGTYRVKFEAAAFITLERDVTVKGTGPMQEDVTLDRAPVTPPPAPTIVQAPSTSTAKPDPNANVDLVMLPDWIEKNLIGRNDPLKETSVGHTPGATATVVQVREPVKDRVHMDEDEMIYVIAGQGVARAKGQEQALDAGAFLVIPRGIVYTLERRGRNPLIALSILGK